MKLWDKISNIGVTDELSFLEQGRIRISNQVIIIDSVLTLLYFIYDLLFLPPRADPGAQFWFYALHIGTILFVVPILLLNKAGWYQVARILMTAVVTFLVLFNSFSLAQPFRTELYLIVVAAFVFVVFNDLRMILPIFFIQIVAYYLAAMNIINHHSDLATVSNGLIFRVVITFSILFFILFFLKQETNKSRNEIEEKNNELSADRDEMVRLNFTKDKIFSIISHDLRSPIGSLQAVLGLIQREHISVEDFKKATAGLEKQVQQLSTSLDELLTWSKAQLHGINPEPAIVKLKPLIYEVTAVNKMAARNKRIIITTNIPVDIEVYCDPNMLKSVITNLTTNAIKFTPVGGAVSIFCKQDDDKVCINVEDTGIGIPQENMEKILNPSIHFSTRGTNNEKGTGLGLVMCREFVLKNQGTFDIKSQDGKGSRFIIKLPMKDVN